MSTCMKNRVVAEANTSSITLTTTITHNNYSDGRADPPPLSSFDKKKQQRYGSVFTQKTQKQHCKSKKA